jgi:hypothetical protein
MKRKMVMFVLVFTILSSLVFGKDAVTISNGPQLFLDNFLIEKISGFTRIMNQPVKSPCNPVLTQTEPWEKRIASTYGTALFEPQLDKYRCWYLANEFEDGNGMPLASEDSDNIKYTICYAESKDGLKWTKPLVGSQPFRGHEKHNIVILGGHGWGVLHTPEDPDPGKRYKGAGGRSFGFSPDGIKWTLHNWTDKIGFNDTSTSVIKWKDEYLAFVRYQIKDEVNWPGLTMRGVGLSRSKDFMNWTPKELVFKTDKEDGYPWTQPYGLAVTPYGDVLIGVLWMFHLDEHKDIDDPNLNNNRVGYQDLQLIVSRDGANWQRVADRAIFLGATPGTWDQGGIHGPSTTMFVKNNLVHFYYSAQENRHGEGWGKTGIGLATLPKDRFVALKTKSIGEPGILQTVPLKFEGKCLFVNAELCCNDDLKVELLDKDGNVIPGFEKEHTILTKYDDLEYTVQWSKCGRDINNADKPLAIRFVLTKGSIYAFRIVDDNTLIVIPDEPNSYLRPAENVQAEYSHRGRTPPAAVAIDEKAKAQILAEYYQKAASFTPAIVTESKIPAGDMRKIHIGMTSFTKKKTGGIAELLDDGFIIDTTDPQNIIIAGPTSWGTEFGVYEFLERYLNIRWLLPGPDGEDVPQTNEINIPKERVMQNPTFFSRLYSGIRLHEGMVWARRNRMHGHINFHHNFDSLFPVAKYAKTHPEFYPEVDGKRIIPTVDSWKQLGLEDSQDWNICFSSQTVVDETVNNICQYFKEHPDTKSYSLGMNDSMLQCNCAKCLATDSGKKNFLGQENLSDRFFTWANAVAEGVLKEYPNKYFGMLAYHQFIEPPVKTKVHKRIIPYFCYERYRWVKDSAARQMDIKVTAEWAKVTTNLGWYDYFYGTPYAAPRVYFHKMVESFRFARDNNVSAMYGEAYPNFGEGPKLYLALKMQWDVDADPDELLNDWYVRCVGQKSASHLKQYFDMWENIWATQIPNGSWWRDSRHYVSFNNLQYLDSITAEDIAKAEELMQKTVALAETGPQKKRAAALAKTFEYYKITWQLYNEDKQGSSGLKAKTSAQAIEFIDKGVDVMIRAQARRKMVLEEFSKNPILVQPISIDRSAYFGKDWGSCWLWKVSDFAAGGDEDVVAKLKSLSTNPALKNEAELQKVLSTLIQYCPVNFK